MIFKNSKSDKYNKGDFFVEMEYRLLEQLGNVLETGDLVGQTSCIDMESMNEEQLKMMTVGNRYRIEKSNGRVALCPLTVLLVMNGGDEFCYYASKNNE